MNNIDWEATARAIFLLLVGLFIGGLIGMSFTKPTQIIREVKVIDTEALQKLQEQFNQLQLEYDTFTNYLEGYYRGYLKARGVGIEE